MSIDGSFSLESALERFLARCPELRCKPQFISLSQKGEELEEEELVNTIAGVFVNPKYSIIVMGCFRPIALKIVDKLVELLEKVGSLEADSGDELMEIGDDDGADVIEVYERHGQGLNLHELACLAFCRALDMAPFLLKSVLNYFKFAPPPFQRLLATSFCVGKNETHVLGLVRTSFRFLLVERQVFSKQWDWSPFMDLVQQCMNVDSSNSPEYLKNILDIRWCGIQILSIILKLSDKATVNFGLDAEQSLLCLLRWEEFCLDTSIEKAGCYVGTNGRETSGHVDRTTSLYLECALQSFGLLSSAYSQDEKSNPFVLTSALKKSFEIVMLAVGQKWPVLLYGPTGAGKTALINKLAQLTGNQVLSIHMDEQLDEKTLIGSYVCAEQPGEFRWQPGSLTQALLSGVWVVFEDIDKAPSDVQSILLPLLEGSNSFFTGHGEAISVSERFRLFATVSMLKNDISNNSEGMISLGALWRRVMINPPTNEDLVDIVNAWHPNLELVTRKLIETYERVNSASPYGCGGLQSLVRFSLRDLLKWCKRITNLGFSSCGLSLSANECRSIYQEAVDIFAASSASNENRLLIMKVIAKIWAVPAMDAATLIPCNRPIIQDSQSDLQVGRVALKRDQALLKDLSRSFVNIRSSLHVLERVACSVKYNEPVLLVGETGTGKTTLVQSLATRLGQPITVLNLSQQSDVADLVGGLKPTDPRFIFVPLYNEFMHLFSKTFSVKDNLAEGKFLHSLKNLRNAKSWRKMTKVFQKGLQKVLNYYSCEVGTPGRGTKRKRPLGEEVLKAWECFSVKLNAARKQIDGAASMTFSFVEGAFVHALRNGHWILLDEVNLAPPDTLQRIKGVLEGEHGSLCLAERGDIGYIDRHPNFRIFACMNPATDSGKRDLPYSLRSRFTEYFVDDILNEEDLTLFVNQFMNDSHPGKEVVHKIVHFYIAVKRESEDRLQDGANQKPHFSLRSLYRALEYTKKAKKKFGFLRALYDGLCMFFLTLLDGPSAKYMNNMILSNIFGGKMPPDVPFNEYLAESMEHSEFSKPESPTDNYILTDCVKKHLRNLSRAILIKRYPVLLQGPTSSGKTSLVQYLASVTGHEFIRINNHEHTDVQEYLGSYVTDANGKLVFQEGALVKAVRNGWWVVLDELNLAPSDVLEALNRLLDDNRELFVPDLQETIHAHPKFMLFATQNPPTFYGGRKMLSRAFRNRFVEIHVDEIPENELITILEKRCKIPLSYAGKMVEVMKDLQLHRQSSKVFSGKHGFITPRDLFRWADRYRLLGNSCEDLTKDGYYLLAERLRDENEKNTVKEILERHFRVKLFKDNLYMQGSNAGIISKENYCRVSEHPEDIIWTRSMRRLYFLVERCYKMREPVLLVGETGGGKTTVCQLLSVGLGLKLHILNCHQHTETSDFLGGFYPVRRSRLSEEFQNLVERLMLSNVFLHFPGSVKISPDIGQASSTVDQLNIIIHNYRQGKVSQSEVTNADIDTFERMKEDLFELHRKWQTIFTWQDGPLVQAMKDGDLFLLDEISLADDSVLERLNSVLETERKLSLAEKGGSVLENITAHPNFFLLATMNPGGDYGKKELSPALRNRFTEIWVPPVTDLQELQSIAAQRSIKPTLPHVDPILNFWRWFNQLQLGRTLTVRDLLSWIDFMNVMEKDIGSDYAFLHGAFLVLLDGLSLGTGMLRHEAGLLREQSLSFLLECLKVGNPSSNKLPITELETYGWGSIGKPADIMCSEHHFRINSFYISKGEKDCKREGFEFLAPTTCRNAMRLLRAMQLAKPVLLEGSPGVGKTSLVVALGKYSGHTVVRINLSEQTDIMDLLGSDLPIEDVDGMKFAWSDGILLQALKKGYWVLLDELNLAPQSVLEGLNAILDHRAEVFIPELGATFKCSPSFRVFACQNPSRQGGGRKGLPKSFLNRFTKVYVDELVEDDYLFICSSLHPSVPQPILSKLICFNKRLYEDTMLFHKYGENGSPWEFNLRDVIRSCQIIEGAPEKSKVDCFLSVVYIQRMRTAADRRNVIELYKDVFGVNPCMNPYPQVQINRRYLIVGNTSIMRNHFQPSKLSNDQLNILPGIRNSLEAVAHCVKYQWLCILVGATSSGKTSLVRLLAQLTGNVLNELNLSSTTDVSELLGSFEQYNAYRNFRAAIAKVERYMDEYCSLSLEFVAEDEGVERKNLVSRWLAFLSGINFGPTSSSASMYTESWNDKFFGSLSSLVHIIEQLKQGLERCNIVLSSSDKGLDKILKNILDLQENNRKRTFPVKFEWVTGLLIKAIESGEWVILENANLCNPTVLDRINSLVETNGSITINECGLVEGKPLVLYPHPNFRLFLTVNPRYGEVSRAMRNRGVEIFLMQPYWLADGEDEYSCKETEIKDAKRFLVLSGIPICELVDAMAEAHMFARDTGVTLGVRITLLELTRWVQLFQQLLINGNSPLWSLHLSWEHTYLSSLGETEGRDAIEHVKLCFLSASKFIQTLKTEKCSLSLPGGWPTPMKLQNFILFSNETSIKQNCMYLQFLGAQFASYELSGQPYGSHMKHGSSLSVSENTKTTLLVDGNELFPSLIPLQMLSSLLFPTTSDKLNFRYSEHFKFDPKLANKMLFFAANWTVEQATESNFKLYLFWFNWYSSKLQPYGQFFESYVTILQQESEHPIWNCIYNCRRELTSSWQLDVDLLPPMLSLKLEEFADSSENIRMCKKHLLNAIQCVRLLRLSLQQWNSEEYHHQRSEIQYFIPLLKSLRELEKIVLDELVVSPCFDLLIQLYGNVLENHILFWNGIVSSQSECLIISWHSLKKNAKKLESFFPEAVNSLLEECRNTLMIVDGNFDSPKSMLWVYGGHPLLPSSSNIYDKMQQLLEFCKLTWPMKSESLKQASSGKDNLVKAIISINPELRTLAMQGVCMLSYLTWKDGEDGTTIAQQLEDMHQVLLERFKNEKHNLEIALASNADKSLVENSVTCCLFSPELLCTESSFSIWETFTFFDGTSLLLDMELLQQLSDITLVDAEGLFPALSNTSEMLELALNFSLKLSSRPPTDFFPHQTLLWVLDAWESVDSANTVVARSVLEMWFRWHSSLWMFCPEQVKIDGCDIPLPYVSCLPVKARMVQQILQGVFPIKDYATIASKLRVASGNIWHDSPSGRDISNFLFASARSLFQQIILAHKKSFGQNEFAEIKAILSCIQGRPTEVEKLQELKSLIASSNHSKLTSLIDSFIEPLLRMLFFQHSTNDSLGNLGRAWLLIGGLRFHLLLSRDDLDPAIKYTLKYSQLVEKISLLELEVQVRQECEHLVGRSSSKDDLNQGEHILEGLEIERRRLLRKVVFRHDPEKFTKLKSECADFQESRVPAKNLEVINSEVYKNWQETATSFIERLSDEYPAYVDIAQPIQVAVYEMKLGLSLVFSNALQNTFLDMIGGVTSSQIMETICCFMQYPKFLTARDIGSCLLETLSSDVDLVANNWSIDINLLRRLCSISKEKTSEKGVSLEQSHASVFHNMLVRVTHYVGNSLLMDTASFKVLHEIFEYFAGLWMDMKVETRAKEDDESQCYKFKPRAFNIETILELDTSNLGNSFCDKDLCLEWQEMLAEDESTQQASAQEHGNLREEWNLVEDALIKNVVHVHNQLFGSSDLVEPPAIVEVSDTDKLFSFLESYKLGMGIMKDPRIFPFSSLDAKLGPEHLLYLCLGNEEKFGLPHSPSSVHNIYKDSNALEMFKMVKPLRSLQQRVVFLLNEWPDHHALTNILDITKTLLSIPLNTPLAKALSGLQFLLRKAHVLEENSPKLSVSDQLQPILSLVSCWQKMELDSWPALLDGVKEQCDSSAAKLWFPLYSVLHRVHIAGDDQFTIQSLDEFIKTSSIGEFKKRLQLLLAFYGQVNTGLCLKFYSSSNLMENLKILFNVFGYYVQFLPKVMEHIEANKRKFATELKELVKLCRWERPDSYFLIETSKRTRQKLRKLIQKFNDVLQQPLMGILNQDVERRGVKPPPTLGPKISDGNSEMDIATMLPVTIDLAIFSDMGRSTMYNVWKEQVNSALHISWPRRVSSGFSLHYPNIIEDSEDVATAIMQSLISQDSCFIYQDEWKGVWFSLEKISRTTIECAALWNDESQSFGKRRALYDLLKLLESCGLSRHKSLVAEGELKFNQASSYFLQPSYDVQHLLLNVDILSDNKFPMVANKSFESHCRMANQYYYKSIAVVELLRQICLNFHKDFNLEQVVRSASFLDHLVIIQQEQRYIGYNFAEQLERLRKYRTYLKDLPKMSSSDDDGANSKRTISVNQLAVHRSMWKQKQLIDSLYSFTQEASLLLRKVENTHLNTCQSVKVAANRALVFVEKFVLNLKKSKESLDEYLLGGRRIVTTQAACMHPFVVSEQMEQLVLQNFQDINEFQEHVQSYLKHNVDKRSVLESLLGRLEDILNKGKLVMEEFNYFREQRTCSSSIYEDGAFSVTSDIGCAFTESYTKSLKQIKEALHKLSSSSYSHALSEDSLSGNITEWKVVAESFIVNIQLDLICEGLGETITSAVRLIDHAGHRDPSLCSEIQICLSFLNVLMDLMLIYGDGILHEFFAMHRTVAEMTHMLASVFASLFSKGLGTSLEDNVDNGNATQDASGTGMGEGTGLNDVSDQINDEDQLLGTSEGVSELDAQNELPGKDEKGIEMDQDFAADTYSVSEDSENDDDNEDDEDQKLESAMGEAGNGSEVVDEKLWNKEEDGTADNAKESYEPGSSVRDMDSNSRELRAKQDDATGLYDSGELSADESGKREDETQNVPDEDENMDDLQMEKETAYTDPTGIQFDEQNEAGEEDVNMEELKGSEKLEEVVPEDDETVENGNDEGEMTNPVDDDMEVESGQVGENLGSDDQGKDQLENCEDTAESNESLLEPEKPTFQSDPMLSTDTALRPSGDGQALDSSTLAPEAQWSNSFDMQNSLAPARGLPSNDVPQTEIEIPDSHQGGKLNADQPKSVEHDTSSGQRSHPNPYRSLGDALEKWKDRVKVSIDSLEHKVDTSDEMEDDNADEYGFVSEFEKGTSQALGSATSDQVDRNFKGNKPDAEEGIVDQEQDHNEREVEKQYSETPPVRNNGAYTLITKVDEQPQNAGFNSEESLEGLQNIGKDDDADPRSLYESVVSMNRSYMSEEILQLSNLTVNEDDKGKAKNLDELFGENKGNATALWRRYELITARLSQELAEQLRLVMEPTVASKLQGDYKTGKRINMKKVIPYIASHYRKDKIWLRRTRPNKRDYQVVVAVDDSRSMSESHCGAVAIEALVTVCRAMSQLDVGQLAVASFGKKGNIRLLHDFNQPFTGEAGINMISSLTFKQENTIADEPVVDLLMYVNNMLDTAVANARLPSGQNPLQQLVLIIADGRFHEKERLRRCVRDLLSQRRMVAFLLVDSPQESVMDFMEASFLGDKVSFTKYLNSFPFPYYIVLKNIEALPRTLADLLRQWFELMQNSRD